MTTTVTAERPAAGTGAGRAGSPTDAAGRRPRRRRRGLRAWAQNGGIAAIVIALPGLLVFGTFSWWPIIRGAIMGFQRTNLVAEPTWVGLGNFGYVLSDPLLPQAVLNTAWFAVLGLVFGFPLPLFLAVFMAELRKARGLFNALSYLPAVIPPVVAILLWRFFYDPSASGTFNTVLGWFGVGPLPWLNSATMAMPSIVIEVIWATAGSTVIVYLAALTQVRTELYEAAELDGCGIWKRVWHVTLPEMRGIILILLLLQIIGTLQVFTEPFIFTGGGPDNSTISVLMLIYNYAFVNADYGAATALSVMLALALCLFSAVYALATRKWGK